MCRGGVGWDVAILDVREWTDWRDELQKLDGLTVEHFLKPPDFGSYLLFELYGFSDSSEIAYTSLSYARHTNAAGTVHCAFLFGSGNL